MEKNVALDNAAKKTETYCFKNREIDNLNLKFHFALLGAPLLLICFCWTFFSTVLSADDLLKLLLVCNIYIFGYSLSCYLHQGRLNRLWQHLQQVVYINETIFELVNPSSQYENEQAFLDALLKKAVSSVDGAEMGSIIKVNKEDQSLYFESCVGIDIDKLRKISFQLDQSFEYRLTQGKNDKLVVIDNIENINAKSSLSIEDQERLLTAPIKPIRSTLSSPIHIDDELYAMMNLDSSETKAFGDDDCNLVNILTHEASNAIALYQKTHQIQTLANYDSLTSLYNRQCFEARLAQWQLKSHLSSYLVLIDMDNLKQINDNQGHQSGDDALVLLAKRLKYHWHEKQLIARYGGDEFIAVCRGPLSSILADMHAIQLELNTDANHIYFSFGIAEYDGHWQRAFRDADIKMYEHKRSNKVRLA